MATGTADHPERRLRSEVRFAVLGPVTVTEGTTALNIGGPKQRTVLAMLVAHAGDAVSVDSIIGSVWGDDAAPNSKRIVQTYVATLRGQVGDAIVKAGQGWRLDVSRDQIDAASFEDLYSTARDVLESNPQRASVALREALAMWRGHPYADIEAHGKLEGEIHRLSELRVAAQAARIDADLALGRDADLVGEIEALIAEHPYSERFRAQHMLALYRAGRQQEALRSYEQMRTVLLEELGVDPTPDLQDLERRILDQDESLRVAPAQTIQRRAVLVADPGDPIEIGHLPAAEREELLARGTNAVQSAIRREGDGLTITAGTTTYVVFDNALAAANVAEAVTRRLDGQAMRMAIDWGDMVLENGRVSGPPVSRAAVMAAVAHKGQVVLSADAQQAIGTSGSGRGLRFENLGSYDLHGVEGSVLIYQLLVGDMPPVFPELETHRLPPPLPGGGDRSVPGYELREELGPGSVGALYRAFQPSVGREVLVEVIGRVDAADADFVRSFEADAQRLSLLDHQNIAQVIDYWRQPDGAFVVYRYPRGGLLSQAASVDAGRVIEQIGSALSHAHSLGMAHGSVRPDRIALDEAGNASLLCFPIAGIDPGVVEEYARFVAPEGGWASVAADIYAFGVLVSDLGLDGPAIEWATSVDPGQRQASVAEFLIELNPLDSDDPADRYTETRNPYKGLAAFHEKDTGDFFGRAAATDELCRALEGSHMLAVVGPSGIGKSSVARAGLVPALRSGGLPGSEQWLITDMLPGSHPFFELQRALERVVVDVPVALTEALAAHQPDALRDITAVLPDHSDLLVLVDQFEELFTMASERERKAFLDLLTTSIRGKSVRFVLTLRADFLDHPLRYSEFGTLLKASTVMLTAPNQEELAEAIAKPSQGVGVEVAPELVERMVAEVHDRPGALPLLQHTLAELFTRRHSDLIGIAEFDELGGVNGSLSRRAEWIYADLAEEEQSAIKQVFLRLVTVVEQSAPTRRRVRMTELGDLDARESIDAFARSRLLVFDNDPETRTPTVEVAHEALLTHWPRLAGWIGSAREDLAMVRRLDEARRDWEANHRDAAYLLTGGRLAQHEAWTSSASLLLTQQQQEFLDVSRQHDELLKRRARRRRGYVMTGFAAAAVIAVVFALSARQNAEEAESERLVASAVVAAESDPELALLLATHAYRSSPSLAAESALHQSLQGQRKLMVLDPPPGSATALATIAPEGDLVAVAGYGSSSVQMWDVATGDPVWDVTITDDGNATVSWLSSIWFAADAGSVFVPLSTQYLDETEVFDSAAIGLYELDARDGEIIRFAHIPCLVRASPAGTRFAQGPLWAIDYQTVQPDGRCDILGAVGILDFDRGDITWSVQADLNVEPTLSLDGRYLAASALFFFSGPYGTLDEANQDENLEAFGGSVVFNTTNGVQVLASEDYGGPLISPDGKSVLVRAGEQAYLYDVATNERLQTFQSAFLRARLIDEGSRIAGATSESVQVFDAATGTEVLELMGHEGGIRRVDLSRRGDLAVSSGFETAVVWDARPLARSDLDPIELSAFATSGIYSNDASAFYLDALSTGRDSLLVRREGIPFDGPISALIPYTIDVLDREDLRHLWHRQVWSAEVGPDGLAVIQPVLESDVVSPSGVEGAARVGAPQLVDSRTGAYIRDLEGCEHYWLPHIGQLDVDESEPGCPLDISFNFFNFEFSSDGSRLSAATELGDVVVWDLESGEIVRAKGPELRRPRFRLQGYRWTAALSSDGAQIIDPPTAEEWERLDSSGVRPSMVARDVITDEEQGRFEVERWVDFLTYVPQIGKVVGVDTDLLIVDAETWDLERVTRAQGAVITDLAISPDGTLAATLGDDNYVVIWDLAARRIASEFPIIGHVGENLRGVAFIDDETVVVAPETGSRLLRFTLAGDELLSLATDSLTRGFRTEECATYDIDPCPTLEEMRER